MATQKGRGHTNARLIKDILSCEERAIVQRRKNSALAGLGGRLCLQRPRRVVGRGW